MLNEWSILFRLILAAVLSGAIGFEREFHGRAAGFRTHILLCVGSTLVMLTSMHIFDIYVGRVEVDPARIAAGVITGIGFLGAGAIMHFRSAVRGLTTAASLWVVAGLGLAVGSGLYFGAIVTTLLTIVTLMVFSKIEKVMIRRYWYRTLVIEMKEGAGILKNIRELLSEYKCDITDFEVDKISDGGKMVLMVGLKLTETSYLSQLVVDIGHVDGVSHVKWQVD